MGEGTGSAATHASLPHCCCAARAAALWPTHPPSLHPARGDVVCRMSGASRSVHKREIRWRDFYPHHLSRVNKKQSPCSLEELHLVQLFIFVCKKCV